jgi:hypothetical protein
VKRNRESRKEKKRLPEPGRWLFAGGLCLSSLSAAGQDALRLATQEQQVYSDLQRSAEQVTTRPEGNTRWGPVDAVFSLSLSGGYNDNVDLSATDKEGSFFVSPFGSAQIYWQPTDTSSLALNVGVGYQVYFDQPQLNQLTISPNSAISYSILVGSVRLRFSDVMSYSLNPVDVGGVSGVSSYGGLQNSLNLSADFELRKAILTVGYNHYNFVSTAAASDPQDLGSDSLYARMSFVLNPAFSLGPEIAGGDTRHTEQLLNDSYNISGGGFVRWDPSDKLHLNVRLGYAYYEFVANGVLPPPAPNSSFYGNLAISHNMTAAISHSLSAGHQLETGYQAANSDAVELTFIRYQINLDVLRDVSINAGVSFNHGEEFGGISDETYDQLLVVAGAGYQLTKHITTSLTYQYTTKSSDVPANDYSQNSAWLTLSYAF